MNVDYLDIERSLRGQWSEFIRSATGCEIAKVNGKGHPCPRCGGVDRAHWREKDGRIALFCRAACGNADSAYGSNTMTTPEQFVMDWLGIDFAQFCKLAADFVGGVQPRQKSERKIRKEISAILSKASGRAFAECHLCSRYAITIDDMLSIDGYLSVPLLNRFTGEIDGLLQIAGFRKSRIIGALSPDSLYVKIGSKTNELYYATDYLTAAIVNRITGKQCIYSPSSKLFAWSGATAAIVKDGEYETLEAAHYAYKNTKYIYPINPTCFEFDGKLAVISYEQLQQELTRIENGTLRNRQDKSQSTQQSNWPATANSGDGFTQRQYQESDLLA